MIVMTKFTGTEWICSENGNGDFFIDSSRGESIGILYKDVPEVEANARLISAAPEMYKILTKIVKFYLNRHLCILRLVLKNGESVHIDKIEELLAWIDGNDSETPKRSKEGEKK